jgi:hypothetical protein
MYVLRAMQELRSRRSVRWTVATLAGALWWWAALRLAAQPAQAGPVEAAVVAGGWGLGLIPLRATARPRTARSTAKRRQAGKARLPRPRRSAAAGPGTAVQPWQGPPSAPVERLARRER